MPQLDFISFFVQIFWITILVFVMHLTYLYLFLSHTGSVIKLREKMQSRLTDLPYYFRSKVIWDKAFKNIKKH